MVDTKGSAESILNFKRIMRKKKIHLAQKGPDQDICPKIGSRKGDVRPKMGEMKVPVMVEGYCFSVQTEPVSVCLCRWSARIAAFHQITQCLKHHHMPSAERRTITKGWC